MGREYVAPVPPPNPADRVTANPPGQQVANYGHLIDRFVTMLLLGVGLLNLIESNWFHFATDFNAYFADTGVATRLPTAIDQYGWELLAANIVFFLATAVWAVLTLRRGRRAYYIPIVGDLAFTIVVLIATYAVAR